MSYVSIGYRGHQRTELDFSISYNEIRGVGFIFDTNRFVEEFEQLLCVHEGGINGAVDGSEHVQGFIELDEVCDEDDEITGGTLSIRDPQGHDNRSKEKAESLMWNQTREGIEQ